MEHRILSFVVMGVDGNLSSPSLLVCLEDGLFDRYRPCRIRDKSTPQRCDSNLHHQLLCLLVGINGMLDAEIIHLFLSFFRLDKTTIYISGHFEKDSWTQKDLILLWYFIS